MARLFFLFIFILITISLSIAQSTDKNEFKHKIGIKSGWAGFRFRDKVISNYLYTGATIPLQLEYAFSNKKFRSHTTVLFNVSDSINTRAAILNGFSYKDADDTFVSDTIGTLDHQSVQVNYLNFNFDLMRKLECFHNSKWQFFAGGAFNFISMNKKFLSLFYMNELSDRFYSLQIMGLIEYAPGEKHVFKYSLAVPVINKTNRVLHLEDAAQSEDSFKKWSFYNQYFVVSSKLNYEFKFATHWSLEALYQFNYIQCSFPRKEQLAIQSLMAGINFHF